MRHPKSDAKIDRIVVSWLHPTRGNATWLAAVADEVCLPTGRAPGTGRFSYIALDPAAVVRSPDSADGPGVDPKKMLVIDNRHRREAVRRIPALGAAWGPRVIDHPPERTYGRHDVPAVRDPVVLTLRPVDEARRGRRHHA